MVFSLIKIMTYYFCSFSSLSIIWAVLLIASLKSDVCWAFNPSKVKNIATKRWLVATDVRVDEVELAKLFGRLAEKMILLVIDV